MNRMSFIALIECSKAYLEKVTQPVVATAHAVSKIARAQAFTEGNKRTAVLTGVWILQNNGLDARRYLPQGDLALGKFCHSLHAR